MATSFRVKTFPEILSSMLAWMRFYASSNADLRVGSVERTILEASAFVDADQYLQIARLLDLFSLERCRGDDVDRKALTYGSGLIERLRRLPANTSVCKISVGDGTALVSTLLDGDVAYGATTFDVVDGSTFPSSGSVMLDRGTERAEQVVYTRSGDTFTVIGGALVYAHASGGEVVRVSTRSLLDGAVVPTNTTLVLTTGTGAAWPASGSVIVDRGTVYEELLAFTRVGDTLTVPPIAFAHDDGISLILSTHGSSRSIPAGTLCFVPPTESTRQIDFRVVTASVLQDGDLTSDMIDVESVEVGAYTRAGSRTINRWTSAPFTDATVTNPVAAVRGADREEDTAYKRRIRDEIQSLSLGTELAIETNVAGLEDPVTRTSVAFAQITPPVSPGLCELFITDGSSTFSLQQEAFQGRDVLIRDAEVGDARATLSNYGPYAYSETAPETPRIFRSTMRGVATAVGVDYLEDTSQAWVVNAYLGMYLKTDDDQFYLLVSNTATRLEFATGTTPSLGSYSVFDLVASPLVPGTDFTFNETTGDLELATPLLAHDALIAASDGAAPSVGAYSYATGLAAYVQRTVNGDRTDYETFPGLKAAGTKVLVRAPNVLGQAFIIRVVPARGYSDLQVADRVKEVVQTYVNALGIGENVILAEIVRRIKGLTTIDDVQIISPTQNVTVPSGTLIRITDTDVVLV